MSKIAFITADRHLYEKVGSLCKDLELQDEVDLYFTRLDKAAELTKKLQYEDVDVIVARGGLALLIQPVSVNIPIIEIGVTGQDLARLFLQAKALTGIARPRTAFIAFDNMTTDVGVIAELASVDLTIHRLQTNEDIPVVVDEVAKLDYDAVFGGMRTVKIARERGLKAILLDSGPSAIKSALLEAKKVVQGRQIEKENAGKFKALIDFSLEGIISIDRAKKVLTINPVATQLLNCPSEKCLGQPLDVLIDLPEIEECLETKKEIRGKVIQRENTWVSLNIGPIVVESEAIGAFLTFQEVSRIQEAEATIRTEILVKKFVAKYTLADIVGQSPQIREVKRIAASIASTDATILIQGESGTGKELFAQGIHNLSPRKGGPFVAINCAALPPNLLESELFGYVEGAFTGATKKGKPGLFEMAHRGTLFLDEISEMDQYGQSRLLRVLQERQIMRLGGDKYIPVDVRVIAASNRDLKKLVESGAFRQDIYYRLRVLALNLPPLRQRRGDVEHLAAAFLLRHQKSYRKSIELADDAYRELACHSWPGNVRELSNFIERLVVTAGETRITGEIVKRFIEDREYVQPSMAPPVSSLPERLDDDARILSMLKSANYNVKKTAAALGISRPTLYRRMKRLNVSIVRSL
jgi:transcriptional regulator with PAS, ATPase and Fis domain